MDWSSYDGVAEEYASKAEQMYFAAPARDLISLLPSGNGARLLDMGTGTGAIAKAAVRAGWRVVGCDPSIAMLRVAGLRGVVCSLPRLPFRSDTFEAVTLGFVLSHVDDVVGALRELKRVAGFVAASMWSVSPGATEPGRTWYTVADRFLPSDEVNKAIAGALPSEERLSTREGWLDVLRDAGFVDRRIETRTYVIEISTDEYLASRLISFPARYMLAHVSSDAWRRFLADSREALRREFGKTVRFETSVNLAVGR